MKATTLTPIFIALCALGCYHRKTANTPAGEKSSQIIAFGLVSLDDTNTMPSFERCQKLLATGRDPDGEEDYIPRDTYDKCFADAMVGVEPRGQRPAPTVIDTDGDGRPDSVRYLNGVVIPSDLYQRFPGIDWPAVQTFYGINGFGPSAIPYGPVSHGYDTRMREPGMVVGDPGRPALQGTGHGYATRKEVNDLQRKHDEDMTEVSEALIETP